MEIHDQSTQPVSSPSTSKPRRDGLSRRRLLRAAAVSAGVVALAGGGAAVEQWWQHGGLNSSRHEPMASSMQIEHLLRRAGFGATLDEITTYRSYDWGTAVDRLINYKQVSDTATDDRLKTLNFDFTRISDQQRWWLMRMALTKRPLLEKMTLFWHGVLTSSYRKIGGKKGYSNMMTQNQFLRTHAFDTFDNILLGITGDPAMLYYLDLTKSRKNTPNENYARELMELFTLGLGHYTQQDVYAAATALTGWHVNKDAVSATYRPTDHNNLTKQFLGQSGNFDYKDIVRILTNHPATPSYICRKLFTFFAYENPSDDDLKPMIDAYVKSGHNMGEVMRTLLLSPQFSSQKAYRARVKSPAEFVVGAYRVLYPDGDGKGLDYMIAAMGQTLFDPPNVAGWPGDKVSALWLNSGTWMQRLNYIDLLLVGSRSKTGVYNALDLQGIISANHIDSPEHFVDYFTDFLLDGNLEAERRTQFIDYFASQSSTGTTNKTNNKSQITLANGKSYPLSNVRGTLYLILASPEYQLN